MAQIFPRTFPADRPWSEALFYRACLQLDDEWIVAYSVPFVGKRAGSRNPRGQGEADFLLLHPKKGILCVEVKGGDVSVEDGDWIRKYEKGQTQPIKNPFEQAADASRSVYSALAQELPGISTRGTVGHCVAFPSVGDQGAFSIYGPRELVIYREDFDDLARSLHRVTSYLGHRPSWTAEEFKKIRTFLVTSRSLNGSGYEELVHCLEQLDQLTDSQKRTIRQLSSGRGRQLIEGGAGTGKTLLAMYRAELLARSGKRVLYICPMKALADHLLDSISPLDEEVRGRLEVWAFPDFYKSLVDRQDKGNANQKYQRRIDRLLDAIAEQGLEASFDCLIIDEAQDIPKDFFEGFELLVKDPKDGGLILIFGDPNQQLRVRREESAMSVVAESHVLDVNCRNSKQVAQVAHEFTSSDISVLETREGIKIRRPKYRDDLHATTQEEFEKLMSTFQPRSLAILTIADSDRRRLKIHGPEISDIGRFQGREADAVIAVLQRKSLTRTFAYKEFREMVRPFVDNSRDDFLKRDFGEWDERFRDFRMKALQTAEEAARERYRADSLTREELDKRAENLARDRLGEFVPNYRDPRLKAQWVSAQEKSWRICLYTMFTRARVVLSIVADKETHSFIDSKTEDLGDREKYFFDEEDS